MRALLLIAFIASCEGRCRPADAVTDEVPGALCSVSVDANSGVCLRGDEVWQCSIQGVIFHAANCRLVGRVHP